MSLRPKPPNDHLGNDRFIRQLGKWSQVTMQPRGFDREHASSLFGIFALVAVVLDGMYSEVLATSTIYSSAAGPRDSHTNIRQRYAQPLQRRQITPLPTP
ncbi:hypothetical protein M231_04679 [Tremella mesenterica]|uniref:Uncharacterized protein n=1 Tax=Tremella mesenterica TaxID=5217 RepID=A0A4Q1BK58_TREME|nr:hypothetical protein M231_04679 [Tremella mesenterica]